MARASVLSPRARAAGPTDLAEQGGLVGRQRIGRRRRALRSARRTRRLVVGVIVATGLATLVALGMVVGRWTLASPRFAVTTIEVTGARHLSREEIVAITGIRPGTSIFRVDPAAAVAALEARPEVRRADVVRALPDRVEIRVEERQPFTLAHAGWLHWIDENGVPLGVEPRAVALELPVISGLSPEDLAASRRAPSPRLSQGVSLIRLLLRSGSPLTQQISEIDVSRTEGPVLYTVDGVEVRLGAEEWEARIPRLAGVLAQVASSGEPVAGIDLRFRDQIVLKPTAR